MKEKSAVATTVTALLVVWLGHCFVDVMIGFWAVYKTLAGLDLAIAGIIAAISPFIGEGMQVVFGTLGDRGYRKALLIGGLLGCASCALLAYTENYWLLFLLYLLTCIGSGAFHPTAVAITSSLTENRKGLFVTTFASGGAVGLAFSHFIFTYWYTHYDGKTMILALPILLLCTYIFFINIPGATHQPAPPGRRYGFSAMKKLFRCKELVTLYASQVCTQSIFWGAIFLLPDVLSNKGYEPWISFGAGHFCFILGGGLMMIPGGHLSDIYSPKLVLFFASLIGMLLYYTFLAAPLLPAAALLSLLFCLGACLGLSHPVAVSFGHKMMPSRPGLVSAFLMGLVWCISESIGPGGGGILTKFFVENAAAKSLACLGSLFVVGMVIIQLLPQKVTHEIQLESV
jgi:FSR family fosmidomycin resistance protein-like MFS transporter